MADVLERHDDEHGDREVEHDRDGGGGRGFEPERPLNPVFPVSVRKSALKKLHR